MHIGSENVQIFVQQIYYVFGLRDSLRSISYKCFECRRFKGQCLQPPMTDLPDARFPEKESPLTFTNVGLDYIGPFTVIQRGKEEQKAYICLFICLATRAVHLEVTEDLTTSACMTAIRRLLLDVENHGSYSVITEATSWEPENKSEDKICIWTMTLSRTIKAESVS